MEAGTIFRHSVLQGFIKPPKRRPCGHEYEDPLFSWWERDKKEEPPEECPECASELNRNQIEDYFKLLGYKVATDSNRKDGRWWEIYLESGWPIFQIQKGVKFLTVIHVLKFLHDNPRCKTVPDDEDFWFVGHGKAFRKLCKQVFEADQP